MPRRSLLGFATSPTASLSFQECPLALIEIVVGLSKTPHEPGFRSYVEFDLKESVLTFPTQSPGTHVLSLQLTNYLLSQRR